MPLAGAVRKLGGCYPAKTAVRTHGVVVRPPCLDDPSRRSQRGEQVFVQTLVAQATIERFYKAILLRLPRGNVVPLDAGVLTPGEDGVTGQFGAVVADNHARQPATLGDGAQLANNPPTRQRDVDDASQAFAAVVVDDVEHAEPPAAGQRVRYEVERPALVGFLRDRHRRPRVQTAEGKLYLFVGIDRTSKFAVTQLVDKG